MTTSDSLFSNNSANLSYTEPHMISVNHEAPHMSSREAVTTSYAGNLQPQHPAEGTYLCM